MNEAGKEKLIVIGAGAAGLMAGMHLADTYDVTILEALSRLGGRIYTLPGSKEAGAEFVHGDLPLTKDLLQKTGATLEPAATGRFHVENGIWQPDAGMASGWPRLLEKMGALAEDMTLDAFLETHFPGANNEALRRDTRSYAAGFDLADPVKASARELYREWNEEPAHLYRIKEGYQSIIQYLADACTSKGARLRRAKKVKEVMWEPGSVAVHTADGDRYEASKLVVTIPPGVFQQQHAGCRPLFIPALPSHDEAWQQIGFGSVMKLLLEWKQPFWPEKMNGGFVISDEALPTWWANGNVLTGWVGGPAALQWDLIDDQEILIKAMYSLSRIFQKSGVSIVDLLENHHIFRWHQRDASLGAYSYPTVHSRKAIQHLLQPVSDTIYFAGEALYNGNAPGTVEAALQSGLDTAQLIKQLFKNPNSTGS